MPRIFWGVLTSHFNFSWFAYTQAYWAVKFSRYLGRKSVVVLGGFDVCEEEDIHLDRRMNQVRFILENANVLLAVSRRVQDKAAGKAAFQRPTHLVYHGFDGERYVSAGPKENRVLTVGFISRENARRKGIDTFVRASRFLPQTQFRVVGKAIDGSIDHLRNEASPNVTFTGEIPDAQLVREMQKASVYVQASLHEGFGCSLAEAMLCECVPVVTDRGALREVVGSTGVYVEPENPQGLATGIQEGLARPELGKLARRRVLELFPLGKRRERLLSEVADVLSSQEKR